MTPNTIRLMDAWLGRPICFVLTLWRHLFRSLEANNGDRAEAKKILFLKLIEQGSTILAYSALLRATEKVGQGNVYFCVFEENKPILDILDLVPPKNVFSIRQTNVLTFVFDTVKVLFRIRKERIDTAIDMEFFSRASAILSFLTGARYRVGYHRFKSEAPYRGDLMTHRVQYNPYIHASVAFKMLVDALDQDQRDVPLLKILPAIENITNPEYHPTDEEQNHVREIIARSYSDDGRGQPIVLLNPNASDLLPIRKWQNDRFLDLAKKILTSSAGVRIIFTGAESEREAAAALCDAVGSDRAISLAGQTSIRDLIVLYTLASVLVTNDSGPAHFASLTDIHIVVLFGPETPLLYRPLGKNTHVLWSGLNCSPCVNVYNHRFTPCKNNICMEEISVDQVFNEVMKHLGP